MRGFAGQFDGDTLYGGTKLPIDQANLMHGSAGKVMQSKDIIRCEFFESFTFYHLFRSLSRFLGRLKKQDYATAIDRLFR